MKNYIKELFSVIIILSVVACKEKSSDDYVAYFGGEIVNPLNKYVLFCKDSKVIDTIPLKNDNTFL